MAEQTVCWLRQQSCANRDYLWGHFGPPSNHVLFRVSDSLGTGNPDVPPGDFAHVAYIQIRDCARCTTGARWKPETAGAGCKQLVWPYLRTHRIA